MADRFSEDEQPAAAIVLRSSSGRTAAMWIVGGLAVLMMLAVIVAWPLVRRTIDSYLRRHACSENMHKLAVALQNYYDEHGVYPPAIVYDARGVPQHSWRVLILPQLGQEEEKLYQRYRLDESWDSAHNRPLADEMPRVYACPVDPGTSESNTSYLALVNAANGQFAAQPPAATAAVPNPVAPVGKLIVEVAESDIVWTEPRDLLLGQTPGSVRPGNGPGKLPDRFSYHIEGSHLVDTDGDSALATDRQMRAALKAADKAVEQANAAE